ALCEVHPDIRVFSGFLFESIDQAPLTALPSLQYIVLGGYGCTSDQVNAPNSNPAYETGTNTIAETSVSNRQRYGRSFYSPAQKNNVFTADWGANICP